MPAHPFQLRARFRYSGDDNHLDVIGAEVFTDAGWAPLEIGNTSPGFLIFVYSFLICQHTYFHANCTENGLRLEHANAELDLVATDNWKIDRVSVRIEARLRGGTADQAAVDYIRQRMRLCPVSVNLVEPPDYHIELEFS
jgi:hypothetical protein